MIERLIPVLHQRGHRVATVKSSREDVLPPANTDTHRHLIAGADMTVFLGPSTTTIDIPQRMTLKSALCAAEVDIVLIEGMKDSTVPKLWCLSREEDISSATAHPEVRALVIDRDMSHLRIPEGIQTFSIEDVDRLADLIEQEAILINALDLK